MGPKLIYERNNIVFIPIILHFYQEIYIYIYIYICCVLLSFIESSYCFKSLNCADLILSSTKVTLIIDSILLVRLSLSKSKKKKKKEKRKKPLVCSSLVSRDYMDSPMHDPYLKVTTKFSFFI